MKKLVRRSLAIAGTAVFATTALWTTASPASAATYNGACGSGYSVLGSDNVGQLGTVFLTYNDSTGQNCVVTIRNNPGQPVTWMNAGVRLSGDPGSAVEDPGHYTTYAGPVYLQAAGKCVDWSGTISNENGGAVDSFCG
ncbi:MAG TPA: spore-associated protein A [Nocardiopsis listeri]|uniref:spore-associated protein A n=1 Tax=Nocardiopsis listeri TaxID=53440 RepID=UPI001D46909B|nr:spore-associated protein A [Nocardiopsis listeri]HJE60698.1 spore-associated protein A [Nocardiopsis listeri]